MNFRAFQEFVQSNIDILGGVHRESDDDLAGYETALGFSLPKTMKWLLSTHGYSAACGIENLDGSVRATNHCRESIQLPKNIFIINDWNDGGVVFAIVGDEPDNEYEIFWGEAADLHGLSQGTKLPDSNDRFRGFAEWVVDQVQFERDNA